MSIKINKSDVKWSYLSLILFNGVNLILLPFILTFLSAAEIGLWYTFTTIAGLVVILDFGFMTTLSRNITLIWSGSNEITSSGIIKAANNKNEINYSLFVKLFKTTKLVYLILGTTIIILLFTIGSYYVYSVSKNELPLKIIVVSWFIYVLAVFMNMRYAYWNAILKGIGAIKRHQQINIITKVTQLIITIGGLFLGYGLIAVSVAYFISIIVNRILANWVFFNYEENKYKIKPLLKQKASKKESFEILKKLLPNTYKQGLVSISNYINLSAITLISSAYLGLTITASLGFMLQVISLITVVANTYFNTYLPQFSSYRLKNQYELLERTFKKAILANYLIIIVSFSGFLLLAKPLLNLLGSNIELLPIPYVLIIMLYMFLYNNHSVFATFIATSNILPHYRAFIISSIIVIALQLGFMNIFKPTLWLLILPILIVQLLYNNWKWPHESIKEIKRQGEENEKKINIICHK